MTHRRSLSDADVLSAKMKANVNGGLVPTILEQPNNRDKDGNLKPRKIIGDYKLVKTIGQGSMGKVKIAINQKTGEKRACKIMPRPCYKSRHSDNTLREPTDEPIIIDSTTELDKFPELYPKEIANSQEIKENRILREAAIVLLLHHPHIAFMDKFVIWDNYYYFFFEYVNGGQMLDYIISHGRLKEHHARKFIREIISAVDYCHQNSIVHRDLKIENVLIDKNGEIKLIDFGLSNLYDTNKHLKTFCGSLYFAAPELLNAKEYIGPEIDIWSIGIILYVLVCGKVPFDDESMPVLYQKIKAGHVEYPAYLSKECVDLLSQMLKVESKERINMNKIKSHPWILKGYDTPLNNFLLPREPLTIPLDIRVLKNMKGFGFGSTEEINTIIEQSISSGIVKEPENFKFLNIIRKRNKKSIGSGINNRSGSIKSITRSFSNSSSINNTLSTDDEEQIKKHILPIINIYYLVAEKLERIEKYKISMEMQNQTAALHHANQLDNYKNRDLRLSAEDILREGILQNNNNVLTTISNSKETVPPTVPVIVDIDDINNNKTMVVTVDPSSMESNDYSNPVATANVKSMTSTPPLTIDIKNRNENIKFEIANSSSEDSINHYTEHIAETLESKEDEFIKMDAEVILDSSIVDTVSIVANHSTPTHPLPQPPDHHNNINSYYSSTTTTTTTNETPENKNEMVDLKTSLSSSKETLQNNSHQVSLISSKRSFSSPSPVKSINSHGGKKRKGSNPSSAVNKNYKNDPHSDAITVPPTNTIGGSSMHGVEENPSLKDKENITGSVNEKTPLKNLISKSKINKIFSGSSNKNGTTVTETAAQAAQNNTNNKKESKSRKSSATAESLIPFTDLNSSKGNNTAVGIDHASLSIPKVAARPRAISASMVRPNMQQFQEALDIPMTMTSLNTNSNGHDLTRHSMIIPNEESTMTRNEPSRRKSFSNLRRFSFVIGKTFSKNNNGGNTNNTVMSMDSTSSSTNSNNIKGYTSNYYVPNSGMTKVHSGELRDLRSNFNYNNRQTMYHPVSFEQLKLGHRRQHSQESASDLSFTDMLTTSPFQFKVPLTLSRADQNIKNVNLKGLFSVSNTSTHSPSEIRQSIITTLFKFGLFYVEMAGSFQCEYIPDYTLNPFNTNTAATTNSNSFLSVVDGSSSFVSNYSYSMDTETFNQEYEKGILANSTTTAAAIPGTGNNISGGNIAVPNNKIGRKIRSKSFANIFVSKLGKGNWKKSMNNSNSNSITTMDSTTMVNPSMGNHSSSNSVNGGLNTTQYTNTPLPSQTFLVTSPDGKNKVVSKSKSMGNIKYNRILDSHKLLKSHLKISKSIRHGIHKKSKRSDGGMSNEDSTEDSQSFSENDLTNNEQKGIINTNNSNSNSSSKSNSLINSTTKLNLNLKEKIKNRIKHRSKDKSSTSDQGSMENIPVLNSSQAPSQTQLASQSQSSFGMVGSSTASSQLLSPPASLQAFSSFSSTRENSNSSIILYDTDNMTSFIPVGNGNTLRNSSSHQNLKYPQNAWQQDYIEINNGINSLSIATGEPSKTSHLKRSITYCVPGHHKTSFTKVASLPTNSKDGHKLVSSNNNVTTTSGTTILTVSNPNSASTSHSRILNLPDQEVYEDYSSMESIQPISLADTPSYITIEPPTPVVTPPSGSNENSVEINSKVLENKLLNTLPATKTSLQSTAGIDENNQGLSNGGIEYEDINDISILSVSTVPVNKLFSTNELSNEPLSNTISMNDQQQHHHHDNDLSIINTNLTSPTSNSLKKLSPNSYANLNSILKQQQNTNNTIRFEIAIVRIPWLNLHGVQFRRISGNLWKYKKICTTILKDLKL